jgi:hypothetical protein
MLILRSILIEKVGLCAIDLKNPELFLSQYPDTQTFLHTCTKLSIYDPVEVKKFLKGANN